jgi:predicted dehydrogenase
MVAEFVSAIAEGRRPQPDGEVGLRTLQIVAAGYESARTGQPVEIAAA